MGIDHGINTVSADYTGERITSLANAVYLRLATPLGSWWADATLGSRLHELAREKDVPRVRRLAVQYAEQALQPLLTDGRAKAIRVSATQPHNGQCALHIEVTDAGGYRETYTHPVRVA